MGFKPRTKAWVVWLNNTTDSRDDEPRKVRAETAAEAIEAVQPMLRGRFTVGGTYTLSEFYQAYPDWRGLI